MELVPKSGFFHWWGSSLIFHFVTKICVPSTIFFIITFDWVINIVRQSQGGGRDSRGAIAHLGPTRNSLCPSSYIWKIYIYIYIFFLVHFYVFLIHLLNVSNLVDFFFFFKLRETILYFFLMFLRFKSYKRKLMIKK